MEEQKQQWHVPRLLDGLKCESEVENDERTKSQGTLIDLQHFGGKGAC
jgi:hypothetical protein